MIGSSEKDSRESELFSENEKRAGVDGLYVEAVLLRSTGYARLYRVSRGGRYFLVKTGRGDIQRSEGMIRREYEMSSGCDHPNIIHVFTMENVEGIGEGIVMEYVDGRDLNEFMSENPDKRLRRKVFGELMDAVDYLHKRGVVHNDLKPENILITHSGDNVRLIDFGLSDDDAHFVVKTPGCSPIYAAPELRDKRHSDARSDIYSLGKILRLLFGNRYWRIAKKALRKDRERRYANIGEMSRAWRRENRMGIVAITGILMLLGLSAVILLAVDRSENRSRLSDSERLIGESEMRLQSANEKIASQQILIEELGEQYGAVKDSLETERRQGQRRQEALDEMVRTLNRTLDRMVALTEDSLRTEPTLEGRGYIMGHYWEKAKTYFHSMDWHYEDIDYTDEIFSRLMRHFESDGDRFNKILTDPTTYSSQ